MEGNPIFGQRADRSVSSANAASTGSQGEDLYSGYDASSVIKARVAGADGPLKSSYGFVGGSGVPTTSSRPTVISARSSFSRQANTSYTAGNNVKRPVTSRKGAGFSRQGRPGTSRQMSSDPSGIPSATPEDSEDIKSPEDIHKALEKTINNLVEESATNFYHGRLSAALDLAKEAVKKDRLLTKQREQSNLNDQINLDLTYTCLLHLAHVYEKSGMLPESLNTYNSIIKNKAFTQAGKLRVNMGNIFFKQAKYAQSIKMYRIALDQIPTLHHEIRSRVLRNIGNAFVKLQKYHDAVVSYESVLDSHQDFQTAYNLVLCRFALGEKENMKRAYGKLSNVPLPLIEQYTDFESRKEGEIRDHDIFRRDALRQLSIDRRKKIERYVLFATKCIAPVIEDTFAKGYEWTLDIIRTSSLSESASELEIAKAMEYLKVKDYQQAIETLKSYEKKDQKLIGIAATNISFLYWLEGEHKLSEKYADIALKTDKFNSKALNNRGNGYFVRGEHENAIQAYQDAIIADALCIESIYNLGLTLKKLKRYDASLQQFEKLHEMTRNSPEVIFHIADILRIQGNYEECLEWMSRLISVVPTDPTVLATMGELHSQNGDKMQAFHYYSEAYRYYPSNLDIVLWMGGHHVENQNYEAAHSFYEKAAMIQPYDVRYALMMASCKRRSGYVQAALTSYKHIHEKFPDNTECLKFIIKMTQDMGLYSEAEEYQGKLSRLENKSEPAAALGTTVDDQIFHQSQNNSSASLIMGSNRSRLTSANNRISNANINTGRSTSPISASRTASAGVNNRKFSPLEDSTNVNDSLQDQAIQDEDVTMFLPE